MVSVSHYTHWWWVCHIIFDDGECVTLYSLMVSVSHYTHWWWVCHIIFDDGECVTLYSLMVSVLLHTHACTYNVTMVITWVTGTQSGCPVAINMRSLHWCNTPSLPSHGGDDLSSADWVMWPMESLNISWASKNSSSLFEVLSGCWCGKVFILCLMQQFNIYWHTI